MNVVFKLHDENLNDLFIREAEKVDLVGLKGHSLVGGMRASLFNAVPEKAVDQLISFMKNFAQRHG
jgi:phosphoserine aminotransferase